MILGIDLGTTNSLCAVFDQGRPRLVENVHGETLTPSVVGVLPGGEVVVGAVAKELLVTRPDRAVACFKRWMGGPETAVLAGQEFSAPELSSFVLKSLRDDAVKRLGYEVDEAVITVPAYFNDHQRKATKAAGELAGLNVRRIVNEPTAASLAYGFHESDAEKTLLVIDLGGGTFDVTLMEVFEKTLEILSTAGESCLGGEDFTDRLLAEALRLSGGPSLEVAELREPLRVARLRQECELAKRQLGDVEQATVRFPEPDGTFADAGPATELTAERFASIAEPLLERLAGPIDRVLRDAQKTPDGIDDVILVGGATRMPILRDFVARRLGKPPVVRFDPDQVVCLGAAVQAASILDDSAVDDMVMTDVCPFTLGVDTSKQFGAEIRSGYYAPVLHRNTTIPVSKEHPFSTIYPNQREVQVDVYQGEHRRVEKNLKLGELTVTGVPPGPAGQAVYIRFTYDLNGILEVEAYAEGSAEKARAVFTNHAGDLSGAALEQAIERLQSFKYYPREDQESQRLLRAAERVVGEISPFQREQLEAAIDTLEAALGEGERELVESSLEHLAQTLSSLGYDARGQRRD